MSMRSFIHDPFPDNHDGFDYAPKSMQDLNNEQADKEQSAKDKKLLQMLASIMV